jgi:putative SbcD/Mre11-related phosphoesterase
VTFRDRAALVGETLVLADVHVGRDATSDVEFPLGERDRLARRVARLLSWAGPAELVVAGDLLHSFSTVPDGVPETVSRLHGLAGEAGARLVVTPGNHDTMLESVYDGPAPVEYGLGDGTVVLHGHEPPERSADRYVVGHDHPKLTVQGRERPCYLRGEYRDAELLMLPAFTRLAAGTAVEGLRAREFQSPLVTDADALRPVVRDEEADETYEFPPLGEFRRML